MDFCRFLLSVRCFLTDAVDRSSAVAFQEITRILWNPKIHYRVHVSLPLVPVLSQINLVPFLFLEDPF